MTGVQHAGRRPGPDKRQLRRRALWVIGGVFWSLCLLLLVLQLAWVLINGPLGICNTGDSNFGELHWSLLPPGHYCTWNEYENGFDLKDGPAAYYSLEVALLIGGGIAFGVTYLRRRPAPPPRRPSFSPETWAAHAGRGERSDERAEAPADAASGAGATDPAPVDRDEI